MNGLNLVEEGSSNQLILDNTKTSKSQKISNIM